MLPYRDRRRLRMNRLLKKLRKISALNKRILIADRELRVKNGHLVKELQKERMKNSALCSELNYIRCENLRYLNGLVQNRATLSNLLDEINSNESNLRDMVGAMVTASGHLSRMQTAYGKLKAEVMEQQEWDFNNHSTGSPVSARPLSMPGRKRVNSQVFPRNIGDNLNVIEEVSHENSGSSVSPVPQMIAKEGSRYERKCKKGLRHLISTRSSLGRKSIKKNSKPDDRNSTSPFSRKDEAATVTKAPLATESTDLSSPELSPTNGLTEIIGDTSEGSSMELTPNANASHHSSSSSTEVSPSESVENNSLSSEDSPIRASTSSLDISRNSRRYSDVLKSEKKSGRTSAASELISGVETYLDKSDLEVPAAFLSHVTVRRGTSRSTRNTDTVVTCSSDLSCTYTETPKRIPIKSEPLDDEGISPSTKRSSSRRSKAKSHCRESFSFYAFDKSPKESCGNDSTLKASPADKENQDSVVSKTKKKKKNKKEKASGLKINSSNCMSLTPVDDSNAKTFKISSNSIFNSTPIECNVKTRKRHPLETIASSTRIAVNNSMTSNRSVTPDSVLSFSPILNCSNAKNQSHNDTCGILDNSNIGNNNSSSGRPRRNACKNGSYKEPPLNVKMRR